MATMGGSRDTSSIFISVNGWYSVGGLTAAAVTPRTAPPHSLLTAVVSADALEAVRVWVCWGNETCMGTTDTNMILN